MADDTGKVPFRALGQDKWYKAAHIEDCTEPGCEECARYRAEGLDKCALCGIVDDVSKFVFCDPETHKHACPNCMKDKCHGEESVAIELLRAA